MPASILDKTPHTQAQIPSSQHTWALSDRRRAPSKQSRSSGKHCKRRRRQVHAEAALKEVLGVLAFSALPFSAVQGLASSGLGKKLQEDLEARKPGYEADAKERAEQQQAARDKSMWYGPGRPKWLGPISYDYPPWLAGTYPADYGYDPAGLAKDSKSYAKFFEYELLHGRWAMLGGLGALVPEVLQATGLSDFRETRWFEVGAAKLGGEDLNYFGVPGLRIAGGQGIGIIAVCQVLLMVGPEYARYCGSNALEPLGVYLPGDSLYPGGIFDPFGWSKNAEAFEDLRVKEMKNSRLAMVAWVGFAAQGWVTQKGILDNVSDFWRDPSHQNIFANLSR